MSSSRIAVLLALPACALLLAARAPAPDASFSIVLTRTDAGWSAECTAGCDWRRLAVACDQDCPVLIDAAGVTTKVRETTTPERFGFIVGPGEHRLWTFRSLGGTAWTTLSWRCGPTPCHVVISDAGINPR